MKREIDIHSYERRMQKYLALLEKADISDRNKEIILGFRQDCMISGLSIARLTRYMGILIQLAEILKIDFDKAGMEDIKMLIGVIQQRNYTVWTKHTYKVIIKRFYKWLLGNDEVYPEQVKWICARINKSEMTLPGEGDLLTEDDIKKMIAAATHPRDKALVSVLYESGARIGEIASLQLKNVKIDEYGVILTVQGKTGSRNVRVINSTPHLISWMECHPYKNDNNTPLWVKHTKLRKPIKYGTINKMIRDLCAKSGIKKRCNPHMFRHSKATFMANHLTEFQMNQYFGWVQGSDMPSTYVHMSGKEIDNAILELNGVKSKATANESTMKPIICSRCDTINSFDSKFCNKCAGILDIVTANELEEKRIKENEIRVSTDNLMNMLMKDKEFAEMLVSKISELGLKDNVLD